MRKRKLRRPLSPFMVLLEVMQKGVFMKINSPVLFSTFVSLTLSTTPARAVSSCTPPTSDREVHAAISGDMRNIYQTHVRSFLGDIYKIEGAVAVRLVKAGMASTTISQTLPEAQFIASPNDDPRYIERFDGRGTKQAVQVRLASDGKVCAQNSNYAGIDKEVCKGQGGIATFNDIVAGTTNPNMDIEYSGTVKIQQTGRHVNIQKLAELAQAGDRSIVEWRYSYDLATMFSPAYYSPDFRYRNSRGQEIKRAYFTTENDDVYLNFEISSHRNSTAMLPLCRESVKPEAYSYMIGYTAKAKVFADGRDLDMSTAVISVGEIQLARPGYTVRAFDRMYP